MRTASKPATVLALGLGLLPIAGVASAAGPSPYASWQERSIKALSLQQIQDYLEGHGMSLALPAELNGYPGPRHVLEMADELDLTPEQLAQIRDLFDDMRLEAISLSEEIVKREAIRTGCSRPGRSTRPRLTMSPRRSAV